MKEVCDWIESGKRYFLYVGEIKGLSLAQFLGESLSREYHQQTECIAIVPDVLEAYPQERVLVVNPIAAQQSLDRGMPVSCRIPARQFATAVSNHPDVIELVQKLVLSQGELLISVFQTLPEMTLDRFPGVHVIGPDCQVANTWNSKLQTYQKLENIVPIPEFRICSSKSELLKAASELFIRWRSGIFLSLEYSAAGTFSFRARSEEELLERLGDWQPPYVISRFVPHEFDPTVLAVVANEEDVFIGGIADQQIANVNKFTGSVYPSTLSPEILKTLNEMTVTVGRSMARTGYRGIFGCDYIVDENGAIFFLEVNARKQGTTMEMCCALENSVPEGSPNLLELEYFAVREHRFPANIRNAPENPQNICWGTYNHKVEDDVLTQESLPRPEDERLAFRSFVNDKAARCMVVEHIGAGFLVRKGSFLGRVIAMGSNRDEMLKRLQEGKRSLENTIVKVGKRARAVSSSGNG